MQHAFDNTLKTCHQLSNLSDRLRNNYNALNEDFTEHMKTTEDYLKFAGDPPKVPEALRLLQKLNEIHDYYQSKNKIQKIPQNEDLASIINRLDSAASSVKHIPKVTVDNSEESFASSMHIVDH